MPEGFLSWNVVFQTNFQLPVCAIPFSCLLRYVQYNQILFSHSVLILIALVFSCLTCAWFCHLFYWSVAGLVWIISYAIFKSLWSVNELASHCNVWKDSKHEICLGIITHTILWPTQGMPVIMQVCNISFYLACYKYWFKDLT